MNTEVKWANGMTQAKTWKSHKMKLEGNRYPIPIGGNRKICVYVCIVDGLDAIDVIPSLTIGSAC